MDRTRPPNTYSPDEAADIIREATELSLKGKSDGGHLSAEDLERMAQEMGVDAGSVQRALASRQARAGRQEAQRRELKRLVKQVVGYGLLLLFAAVVNFLTGGGWWVQWLALGLGIAVAARVFSVLKRVLGDGPAGPTDEERPSGPPAPGP